MEQVRAAEYRARQVAMQQMASEQKQASQGAGDGMYMSHALVRKVNSLQNGKTLG